MCIIFLTCTIYAKIDGSLCCKKDWRKLAEVLIAFVKVSWADGKILFSASKFYSEAGNDIPSGAMVVAVFEDLNPLTLLNCHVKVHNLTKYICLIPSQK